MKEFAKILLEKICDLSKDWDTRSTYKNELYCYILTRGLQGSSVEKNLNAHAGEIRDTGWIPESGRSPEGGHGNPF